MLSLQLRQLAQAKEEIWTKIRRVEVLAYLSRKRKMISRTKFEETLLTGKKGSEELQKRSNDLLFVKWRNATNATVLRALYNSTSNLSTPSYMKLAWERPMRTMEPLFEYVFSNIFTLISSI